jgi:hypothetical protein
LKRYQGILLIAAASLVALAGCGPVRLIASTNIPTPLVMKIPVGIALFIPQEFSQYVHHEERWSTDWNVELGVAQTDSITRLLTAMFERVVAVESVNAGVQTPGIRAILEPSIEEYAFVTPRDAGSPFFAVSIKYRVNVYLPDGKLADSWGFTGYGTSPAQGLSSTPPRRRWRCAMRAQNSRWNFANRQACAVCRPSLSPLMHRLRSQRANRPNLLIKRTSRRQNRKNKTPLKTSRRRSWMSRSWMSKRSDWSLASGLPLLRRLARPEDFSIGDAGRVHRFAVHKARSEARCLNRLQRFRALARRAVGLNDGRVDHIAVSGHGEFNLHEGFIHGFRGQ